MMAAGKRAKRNKKGAGRPPLPRGEAREIELRVRMNRAETERIRKAAEAAGLSVGEWVRASLERAWGRG